MRRRPIGDPWVESHLLRAEEILAEARAFAEARRALLGDSDAPRRRARTWFGAVLLTVGGRLRRSAPMSRAPGNLDHVPETRRLA
jgi:hypothetical protein